MTLNLARNVDAGEQAHADLLVYCTAQALLIYCVFVKKAVPFLLLFSMAVCVWAADFWQSKPFTEWSDKEVQRILQNSPWSHSLNVSAGGPVLPSTGNSRRNRNPGETGDMSGPAVAPASSGIDDPSRGGSSGRGGLDEMGVNAAPTVVVTVRWQSSLAVKQALIRFKYGNEAATSSEARKLLDSVDGNYVVVVSGITKLQLWGDPETLKKAFLEQSALIVKGQTIKPVDFMTRADRTIDAYFAFPKTRPITIDDKDVEFLTRLNGVDLRQRFHLKDMLLNGKLEL